jgi:hypothetical protein
MRSPYSPSIEEGSLLEGVRGDTRGFATFRLKVATVNLTGAAVSPSRAE